jgi:putative membrane protein
MFKLFTKWILLGVVVYLLPQIIPDIVVASFTVALIASAVIGVINLLIKPVVKLLTLPLNLLTLGFFGAIVNAGLFWLGTLFVNGFEVTTVIGVVFGSIVLSLARWIIDELF